MKRWVLITAVSSEVQIEGESLFDQMRKLRLACAQHSGTIVDEIEIPGMSRSFIDWHELKAAAASEGITGFQRIEDHWKARDFDVMAAIDTTRLWRTDALTVYGMARIYEAGGVLFTSRDGFIEAANRSMFSLMAGFQTQKEIETLKARWLTGMRGRLKRSLPPTGLLPFSHRLIYDNKGNGIEVELDPSQLRTLDKIAELFLDGVPYPKMGAMLAEKWGLFHPSGRQFAENYFQRLFWTPGFWGHITLNRRSPSVKHQQHYEDWVFGPGGTIPAGVEVQYNAYPSAYDEPLRSDIIAQVRKRRIANVGRANHTVPFRYTGLLMCGVCRGPFGHELRRYVAGPVHTYRCSTCRYGDGGQTLLSIHQDEIDSAFKRIVSDVLAGQDMQVKDHTGQQIEDVKKHIVRVETRIDRLIDEKLDAHASVKARYDERLRVAGEELSGLQSELAKLGSMQFERRQQAATRQSAAEQIRVLADGFWSMPDHKINRLLHLFMGDYRLVVKDGQAIDVDVVSYRKFPVKYIHERGG